MNRNYQAKSARVIMLLAILLIFAAIFPLSAVTFADNHRDTFETHWEILMPSRMLYLGNDLPKCTDETANLMAWKRDKSLWICAGREGGWKVMNVE